MDGLNSKIITTSIADSIEVKTRMLNDEGIINLIEKAADLCVASYRNGSRVLLAGNGGSAADSQHIAAEFVSRFNYDRPGLPAIALTTDTSMLTAIGNDYGYENLFKRQLEANGKKGDIFIGISTSGNSKNIINALNTAREMGITTIGLTGNSGGTMDDICDICLKIPSDSTPRVQECHIVIGHIICQIVEDTFFKEYDKND